MKKQNQTGAIILFNLEDEATLYANKTARDAAKNKKRKTKYQLVNEIKDLATEVRHLAHTYKNATRDELILAHTQLQVARFQLTSVKAKAQTLSIPK